MSLYSNDLCNNDYYDVEVLEKRLLDAMVTPVVITFKNRRLNGKASFSLNGEVRVECNIDDQPIVIDFEVPKTYLDWTHDVHNEREEYSSDNSSQLACNDSNEESENDDGDGDGDGGGDGGEED